MSQSAGQLDMPPPIDPSITARLNRVAVRLRSYLFVEGVAWVLAAALIGCSIQLFLDYVSHGLQWSMRFALALLVALVILRVAIRRLIGPLRVSITPTAIANLVERRNPQLASTLISAVRFSSGDVGAASTNAPGLMARVVRDAGAMVSSTNFDAVLTDRRARKSGFVILAVVLTCVVSGIVMPNILGIWFTRNILLQNVDWPRRTQLVLNLPGDELVAARGDDVVIEATADGVQPRFVEFFYETISGKSGRELMVTIGSSGSHRYQYIFKNAQEDFTFHLRGGDDRTADFRARLLERPRLIGSGIKVEPPVYSGLDRAA